MTANFEPIRTLDTLILVLAVIIIASEALLALAPKLSVSIDTLGIRMGARILETLVNVGTDKTIAFKAIFTVAIKGAFIVSTYTIGGTVVGSGDTLVNIGTIDTIAFEATVTVAIEGAFLVGTCTIGGTIVGSSVTLVNIGTIDTVAVKTLIT